MLPVDGKETEKCLGTRTNVVGEGKRIEGPAKAGHYGAEGLANARLLTRSFNAVDTDDAQLARRFGDGRRSAAAGLAGDRFLSGIEGAGLTRCVW